MESGFSGFSDVELSRLRHNQSPDAPVETKSVQKLVTVRAFASDHVSATITQSTEAELNRVTPIIINASQKRRSSNVVKHHFPPHSNPPMELPSAAFFSPQSLRDPVLSPSSSSSLSPPSFTASYATQPQPQSHETEKFSESSRVIQMESPVDLTGESISNSCPSGKDLPGQQAPYDRSDIKTENPTNFSNETSSYQGKQMAVAVVGPSDHRVLDQEDENENSPLPTTGFQPNSPTQISQDNNFRPEEDQEAVRRQVANMEVFQEHQKQMEEANRLRREMLSVALEAKRRATAAEQQKLVAVQRELQMLDQQLNIDVSILRDKIEEASREYMDAQKVFAAAEAEYVRAKMELHKKTDQKELLTGHLCVIIQENEVRKARKLAELMAKLEIDSGEYLDMATSRGLILNSPEGT